MALQLLPLHFQPEVTILFLYGPVGKHILQHYLCTTTILSWNLLRVKMTSPVVLTMTYCTAFHI